jgi:hypothetical protein
MKSIRFCLIRRLMSSPIVAEQTGFWGQRWRRWLYTATEIAQLFAFFTSCPNPSSHIVMCENQMTFALWERKSGFGELNSTWCAEKHDCFLFGGIIIFIIVFSKRACCLLWRKTLCSSSREQTCLFSRWRNYLYLPRLFFYINFFEKIFQNKGQSTHCLQGM